MSTRITFAPPPWVTALLLRPPPSPPPPPPRCTPPSAMRHLVAQWLVYVTDDVTTPVRHPPHLIARFRGWLAFVFRIPSFVRPRREQVHEPPPLPTAQFTLIQNSLYFSSSVNNAPNTLDAPPPAVQRKQNKPPKVVEQPRKSPTIKLSPLYKSLYFSGSGNDESGAIPMTCESPLSSQQMGHGDCVHSFFLTDASGEGKGILEGLKEIKAQKAESQRKRGWVPAVVSLILIALNPLK